MIVADPGLNLILSADIDKDVKQSIIDFTLLLNSCYGNERYIQSGLRGFACIIENEDDIHILKEKYYLDIAKDIFETEEHIGEYISRLYILSSDYAIKVYMKGKI